MEIDRIKRLLNPQDSAEIILRTIRLLAKYPEPEVASNEAKGYSMETDRIEKLLDPEYQREMAFGSIRLIAKFFGQEVAFKEAEGYSLSEEDVQAAINTGIQEAKELPARLDHLTEIVWANLSEADKQELVARALAEDPNDSLLQES